MYLGAYKQSKNICNRACEKVSNVSIIHTLNFEMLSAGNHYSVMAKLPRKKHGFVQLYAKLAHLIQSFELVCCEALTNLFALF